MLILILLDMFDFNNIDIENTSDSVSKWVYLENALKSVDGLIDFAESMNNNTLEIRKTLLEYIGEENLRDTVIGLGNSNIELEIVDSDDSSNSVTITYCIDSAEYDAYAKSKEGQNNPKLTALAAMFVDELEVAQLVLEGSFEVEITEDDPDVGYWGGVEVTNTQCDGVHIEDLDGEVIVKYLVSYPRKLSFWEQKKTGKKYDTSKVHNVDIGKAFEGYTDNYIQDLELNTEDYYYEPDYDYDRD